MGNMWSPYNRSVTLGMQSGYTTCCFFCVNGTAEQKTNITTVRIGPCVKTHFQGKSVLQLNTG